MEGTKSRATKNEMEDTRNGRHKEWKTQGMEDRRNGRQKDWKTEGMEDKRNGRQKEWKTEGMEDNEIEWKARPMLGAQRIYLQYKSEVIVSHQSPRHDPLVLPHVRVLPAMHPLCRS
jgi:hypothetical protein